MFSQDCVAQSWHWVLFLCVVMMPIRDNVTKENWLSFSQELSNTNSSLDNGAIISSFLYAVIFVLLEFVQDLCMLSQSPWAHICICCKFLCLINRRGSSLAMMDSFLYSSYQWVNMSLPSKASKQNKSEWVIMILRYLVGGLIWLKQFQILPNLLFLETWYLLIF